MAEKVRGDKTFVRGLKRLFSSDAIVRHVNDGKGLKVIDTDGKRFQQALKKDNYKRFYQRYLIDQTQGGLFQFQRKELFKDYEAMEKDPILNSALDIYADECLWRIGLDGRTPCNHLTATHAADIVQVVTQVMHEALVAGGTSFDALYVNVNGESGYFSRSLAVYGREGKPCDRCGNPIIRSKFMNRSSFHCVTCQPPWLLP